MACGRSASQVRKTCSNRSSRSTASLSSNRREHWMSDAESLSPRARTSAPWSSLRRPQLIDPCPVTDDEQLAEPIKEGQLATIVRKSSFKMFKPFNRCAPFKTLTNRHEARGPSTVRECLNRQRPFGRKDWQAEMAMTFGLGNTLRPRGRPRSEKRSSLSPL